jgi:hypothetical protein
MKQNHRASGKGCFGLLAAALVFFLPVSEPLAAVYAHQSPISFTWAAAGGSVLHYNVYSSVDGQPFTQITEVTAPACRVPVENGHTYVVRVDAENMTGEGPMSDPSEPIIVSLSESNPDTDGDGMPDVWERSFGLDPLNPADGGADRDGDGLLNRDEFVHGTSPTNPDTDADGLSDGQEVQRRQNPKDPGDNRPLANAGADQDLAPGRITLDGTGSRDPNGDLLSFTWTQVEGPEVTLVLPRTPKPWLLGKKSGQYRFRLVVTDGKVNSPADDVVVTIRNAEPSAEAGPDQVVNAGSVVTLNGGGSSDPNEDALIYAWSQKEGPAVSLQANRQRSCWFVPETSGVYRFALVVSDGTLPSMADEVQVIVHGQNHVPTAEAGADQVGAVNTRVTLDGSGSSDADGNPLTYAWSQMEGPALVLLKDAWSARPSFVPSRVGVYRFKLVVRDGTDASAPDAVTVTVEGQNHAPVAVTNEFVSAAEGEWVTLNGEQSFDPDNDPLTYAWSQVQGPAVSLEGADTAKAGFYAVGTAALRFELVVDDGELYSSPAKVDVTVDASNELPRADGGEDLDASVGSEVCLDGSGSFDLNSKGDITFSWFQTEGPRVTLQGADTATPCFTPSSAGQHVFGLVVSQGALQSAQDLVTVRVDMHEARPGVLFAGQGASSGGCMSLQGGTPNRQPGLDDWLFVLCLFLPSVGVMGALRWKVRRDAAQG